MNPSNSKSSFGKARRGRVDTARKIEARKRSKLCRVGGHPGCLWGATWANRRHPNLRLLVQEFNPYRQQVRQGRYFEFDVFPRALHRPQDPLLHYGDEQVRNFAGGTVRLCAHRLRILDVSRVSFAQRSNAAGSAINSLTFLIALLVSSSSGASLSGMSAIYVVETNKHQQLQDAEEDEMHGAFTTSCHGCHAPRLKSNAS